MKYTTPDKIFKGEIGELGGIRFLESSIAKVYKGDKIAGADNLTINATVTAVTTFAVKETVSEAQAAALEGRKLLIGTTVYEVASATDGSAGTATITVKTSISANENTVVYPGEGGKNNAAVFATLVCGKDAYMSSQLEGEGNPFKMITKTDSQTGSLLNMYSSVGWRAVHAATVAWDKYMVRIESGCSLGSTIKAAN